VSLQLRKWERKKVEGHHHAVARVSPFLLFCQKKWDGIIDDVNVGMASGDVQTMETDSGTDSQATIIEQKCKEKLIEEWKSLSSDKLER